ncbi:hypothetical protein [Nocardia farcinica]|uniref:hypothetical protein n=1 Tax=Nocardia farcinica TaxID=37329 RepID=UPI002B4B0B63|nr:hypothetical protein [Nocardia farcinica]
MPDHLSDLPVHPRWCRTGDDRFPVAASVDGAWWVLRRNPFPDHDLWTVFVDGAARYDMNDLPAGWGRPLTVSTVLEAATASAILAVVEPFAVYGSEVGAPCDDPFCCG